MVGDFIFSFFFFLSTTLPTLRLGRFYTLLLRDYQITRRRERGQDKKLYSRKFRKIEITDACINDIPLGFRKSTRFKINSAHEIRRKGCEGTVEKDLATFSACLSCKVILCILRSCFRHSFVRRAILALSLSLSLLNRDKRVKIVEKVDMDNLAFYIQSLEISEKFIRSWIHGEKKIYVC